MIRFIKRLFCSHQWEFVRDLYGDQIIEWGYKRSAWACSKCGAMEGRDELHNPPAVLAAAGVPAATEGTK